MLQITDLKFLSKYEIRLNKSYDMRIYPRYESKVEEPKQIFLYNILLFSYTHKKLSYMSMLHLINFIINYIKSYFRIFPICSINNSSATNFGNLFSMTIKRPTADFIRSNDVLDEEDSVGEPERQLVKQFDVLKDVVVGGTGVGIFIVVTIDQKFDYGFHGIGRDQSLINNGN